jgi:uncharacterized iron-regulated membrane protein
VPVGIIIVTGLMLQLKKQSSWVQPDEYRGTQTIPTLTFDQILSASRTVPEAQIETWADINRLDVRPSKGMVKVRAENNWEIQIDAASGEVLHHAFRRSDIIESIHDGSFFHNAAKLWVFLPAGIILLALWLTGMYLWALPIVMRRRGRIRRAAARQNS